MSNKETVIGYFETWINSPQSRVEAELISVFKESHDLKDDFYWIIKNGQACDPQNNNEPINFKRITQLQKSEGAAFDNLIIWADQNSEGKAIILSPSRKPAPDFPKGYPQNKICFYEIAYTFEFPPQKVLLATTITFTASQRKCIDIAKNLKSDLNIKNPESLRNKFFPCPQDFDLISLLEEISKSRDNIETPDQQVFSYFASEIKSGRDSREVFAEMQQKGIVGNNPLHCDRDDSILTRNSLIFNFAKKDHNWEWKIGDCVRCSAKGVEVGPCKICRKCNAELDKEAQFTA